MTLIGLASGGGSLRSEARGKGTLTEVRLAARPVPRGSLLSRLMWTLWTDLRLVMAGFRALRAADGVLFTGSPPFMIHLLAPLKFLWRGRLVYRITDFHPECLIAAQSASVACARPVAGAHQLLAPADRRLRGAGHRPEASSQRDRRAAGTDRPGARRLAGLVRRGEAVEPLPAALAGSCVLLYAGNYGVAHEVDTVAEGYARHHREGSGRVRLWLSATGGGADDLARRLTAQGLPFHRSPPVPLERLAGLLRAPDAHLVTLKDAFRRLRDAVEDLCLHRLRSADPVRGQCRVRTSTFSLARPRQEYWRVPCGDVAGFAGCA